MFQNSFLSIAQTKKLRCERFLDEMNAVIPWEEFIPEISPYYGQKETGRRRMDLLMMLKIYFLQQWYNLSDPAAEEAIYDRNSFQKFLGIDLLSQSVPDETTILNFRHLLEENELQKRFFDIVSEILEKKGLLLKEGTIVDATITAAPSSTKNEKKERDPEMGSTKKGNQWHFGMKGHIGVDACSGLVHSVEGTSASVHDKTMMEHLLHYEEKAIFGDKGYYDSELKRESRDGLRSVFWGVLDKGTRGRKLSGKQKKRNSKLSSVRSKVEHPFQVLRCQWNYTKIRYRGIFKNTMQLKSLFMLYNLYKVRKVLPDMS